MPGPTQYSNLQFATNKGKRATATIERYSSSNQKCTFGLGRDQMKKLHVDDILHKGLRKYAHANPDFKYKVSHDWPASTNTSLSKTSPKYSFTKSPTGMKDHFYRQIQKQSGQPGPGSYNTPL